MSTRLNFAQKTAQRVEFAGFGPCQAIGPKQLLAHCEDILHRVDLETNGLVKERPWPMRFQNALAPEVAAVLSVIESVWGRHAGLPMPIHDTREWQVDKGLRLICRYLWRHEIRRPDSRLVLTELHLDGLPQWHSCHHMRDGHRESAFHHGATAVMKQFMDHGQINESFDRERLLQGLNELNK